MNESRLIASYFVVVVLTVMSTVATYHSYLSGKIDKDQRLACQIGFRLSTLKYKVYHTVSSEEIKKDAEFKCEDYIIKSFIERHTK
jgi:hypothetical protein